MLLIGNKGLTFPMYANYIKNLFAMKIAIGFKLYSTQEQKKARATMAVGLVPWQGSPRVPAGGKLVFLFTHRC